MKLQVLLYHTHTHQTMLNPNFNYTFLKSVFGNKGTPISFLFIQVPILYISPESPFPAPGPLKALFHLSVSILYHLGICSCGFIPNLTLKIFAAVQYINSPISLSEGVQVFPLYPQST